jgi:hypothetical protein
VGQDLLFLLHTFVPYVFPYCLGKTLSFCSGVPRGGYGGFKPSPKFQSFDKAERNSVFRGKYIRNSLVFLFHHPN